MARTPPMSLQARRKRKAIPVQLSSTLAKGRSSNSAAKPTNITIVITGITGTTTEALAATTGMPTTSYNLLPTTTEPPDNITIVVNEGEPLGGVPVQPVAATMPPQPSVAQVPAQPPVTKIQPPATPVMVPPPQVIVQGGTMAPTTFNVPPTSVAGVPSAPAAAVPPGPYGSVASTIEAGLEKIAIQAAQHGLQSGIEKGIGQAVASQGFEEVSGTVNASTSEPPISTNINSTNALLKAVMSGQVKNNVTVIVEPIQTTSATPR